MQAGSRDEAESRVGGSGPVRTTNIGNSRPVWPTQKDPVFWGRGRSRFCRLQAHGSQLVSTMRLLLRTPRPGIDESKIFKMFELQQKPVSVCQVLFLFIIKLGCFLQCRPPPPQLALGCSTGV